MTSLVRINLLTENFQKPDYPFETEQELNDRLKSVSEEGGWGITKVDAGSGTIENTIEVPSDSSNRKRFKISCCCSRIKFNK